MACHVVGDNFLGGYCIALVHLVCKAPAVRST